jgi:aryl-alcohol dehydrogenase-like predicted oxidoreductase
MIDLHAVSTEAEIESFTDILETLTSFVREGKIRAIGLSNDTAWGIMKYVGLSNQHKFTRIASVQNEYSLLYRVDEVYVGEVCVREDVSYLPYSPLGGGMISGKYLNGARPAGARWSLDSRPLQRDTQTAQQAIRAYMDVARKHGLDVCQMALQFVTKRPFVTSNIIGATSMEQLKSDIASIDLVLTPEIMRDIDAVYKQYPIPY